MSEYVLLLVTLAVFGNAYSVAQQTESRHAISADSRLMFDVQPGCIPAGENILRIPVVRTKCPCFVSFALSSQNFSNAMVDFLVMPEMTFDTWNATGFISTPEGLSPQTERGVSASLFSFAHDVHIYQSTNKELDINGNFVLAIRTTSPTADCSLSIRHIFEAKPAPCPVQLPNTVSASKKRDTVIFHANTNSVVAGTAVTDPTIQAYMVAIRSSSGSCSGTVVARNWILTAAHCQVRVGGQAYVAGTTNLNGVLYKVAEFIPHPSYAQSLNGSLEQHDIALVRIDSPIVEGVPLLLNIDRDGPDPGEFVRASGYGQIAENWIPSLPSRSLLQIDLPTVQFAKCVKAFVNYGAPDFAQSLNGKGHICVGVLDGDCAGDTCYGDSGGPIVVREQSTRKFVQVGIVSGGIGCARRGLPGVYTRVAAYYNWVKNVTNGAAKGAAIAGADVTIDLPVDEAVDAAEEDTGKQNASSKQVPNARLFVTFVAVGLGVILVTGMVVLLLVKRSKRREERELEAEGSIGSEEREFVPGGRSPSTRFFAAAAIPAQSSDDSDLGSNDIGDQKMPTLQGTSYASHASASTDALISPRNSHNGT